MLQGFPAFLFASTVKDGIMQKNRPNCKNSSPLLSGFCQLLRLSQCFIQNDQNLFRGFLRHEKPRLKLESPLVVVGINGPDSILKKGCHQCHAAHGMRGLEPHNDTALPDFCEESRIFDSSSREKQLHKYSQSRVAAAFFILFFCQIL